MLRNVFLKSLRDQRRSLMYWGVGVAALTVLTVLFYPTISEAEELSQLFDDSDVLAQVFAGGFTDMTTPEGFLNSQLFSLLVPILLIIMAVSAGSGAIAGEEEKGTLDVLLSNPTTRLQVVVHKFAAMVAALAVVAGVMWVSIAVGAFAVDMDVSLVGVGQVTLSGLLLGILFGALALAIGSARGKRGLAIGVTGAAAVATYFVYALAPMVEELEWAQYLAPMYYYIGDDPLVNGLNLLHAGTLAVASAVLVAVSVFTFERRDLAV